MPQVPRELTPDRSAHHFFGSELRHLRESSGLSQKQLGLRIHASGAEISRVEKAERWPPPGMAEACDTALGTDGILSRLWPLVEMQRRDPSAHVDRSPIYVDSSSAANHSSLPAGTMR